MAEDKKIALLGLSADPPHSGHLWVAQLLLKSKQADEVWLIPCYRHSFGKFMASAKHRWKMTKLLEGPGIKAKDAEMKRKGVSYTVDTVELLKKKYPDCRFFWTMGSDIVKSGGYKKWRDWGRLSSLIDFLVVNRAGFKLEKAPAGFVLLEGRFSDISSTEIRKRVREGLPITGLVPPKIEKYIEKHKLYQGS